MVQRKVKRIIIFVIRGPHRLYPPALDIVELVVGEGTGWTTKVRYLFSAALKSCPVGSFSRRQRLRGRFFDRRLSGEDQVFVGGHAPVQIMLSAGQQ
ncbi:unnamed protein product [Macrosiphum euphorbiae]|uniref:Uncharacterized protein n=1 Tax=Macrosiphum euphorbiae TaxID=13131 RepID=A0AAV0XJ02_9HEMI|nr:unnamed protein product [Macrosiphum euphorbiae]